MGSRADFDQKSGEETRVITSLGSNLVPRASAVSVDVSFRGTLGIAHILLLLHKHRHYNGGVAFCFNPSFIFSS